MRCEDFGGKCSACPMDILRHSVLCANCIEPVTFVPVSHNCTLAASHDISPQFQVDLDAWRSMRAEGRPTTSEFGDQCVTREQEKLRAVHSRSEGVEPRPTRLAAPRTLARTPARFFGALPGTKSKGRAMRKRMPVPTPSAVTMPDTSMIARTKKLPRGPGCRGFCDRAR